MNFVLQAWNLIKFSTSELLKESYFLLAYIKQKLIQSFFTFSKKSCCGPSLAGGALMMPTLKFFKAHTTTKSRCFNLLPRLISSFFLESMKSSGKVLPANSEMRGSTSCIFPSPMTTMAIVFLELSERVFT